ncbi:SHOCT domain-containing protein [Bacillus sp. REN3]|uniref:SHOCT domain-containing protein n=1 Tax=Bacillus sp. REN3 TaxID=2802440 RepID=UPI001AEE0B5D|nr:SHOCT domain-containing protein [Bacillus sp. REN3]
MGPVYNTACFAPIGIFFGFLLVGLLFFYFFKNKRKPNIDSQEHPDQGAMEQLKMRLARGEITTDEYQQIKEAITKSP